MIIVECANCQRIINAADKYAGRIVKCPQCQASVAIPAAKLAPPPPPVATAEESRDGLPWLPIAALSAVGIAIIAVVVMAILPDRKPTTAAVPESALIPEVAEVQEGPAIEPSAEASKAASVSDASLEVERTPPPSPEVQERIKLEDLERMTGRDWIALDDAERKVVIEFLAMSVVLADSDLDPVGATPLAPFFDDFYSNRGNLNTRVFKAGDAYIDHARGVELRASGRGNATTDSFYYPGDGIIWFNPQSTGEAFYSISVYDDSTTRIVAANVLMNPGKNAAPEITKLRLPAGNYYLEVNSTVPWELMVANQRGIEWLKRKVHAFQNEAQPPKPEKPKERST